MNHAEEIGLLKSRVAVLEGNAKLAQQAEDKLRHRIDALEQQMPKVGRLIDDSNEYTLCILFRHVIGQPVEPGKRARLVVEQTEDGAGRIYLDHLNVEDKEVHSWMKR